MIIYFEVWLAVALLYFIGESLTRKYYVAISFPIFSLISITAFVSLVSISVTTLNLEFAVLVVSAILFILTVLFVRNSRPKTFWIGARALFYGSITALVSFITQYFGLAGVAFSDGFTILRTSLWLQGVLDVSPLVGDKGVKRGYAISAVQSLGQTGEYLVGFVPIIFIAATISTLFIVFRIISNRQIATLLSIVLVVVFISTEAILRHLYLMNSHSLIWLAFAVTILMVTDNGGFVFERALVLSMLPLFSSLAFARLDAIWIFAPLLIPIALANFRANKTHGLAILFAVIVSLTSWLFIAVTDFPFGGTAGVVALMVTGVLGFFVVNWILPEKALDAPTISKIYYFASLALAPMIIIISNFESSLENLVLNLFLGEGLWGATVIALMLISLIAIPLLIRHKPDEIQRFILSAGLLSLLFFVCAKLADGFDSGSILDSVIARSGWGDSLNRMLVAYIPFAVIFVSSAMSKVLARKGRA